MKRKYYRWIITIRIQKGSSDMIRTITHNNIKKIVNFNLWSDKYILENGLDALSILNIERLPSKCWVGL